MVDPGVTGTKGIYFIFVLALDYVQSGFLISNECAYDRKQADNQKLAHQSQPPNHACQRQPPFILL
jgi:hypothetical protein